MTEPYLPSRQQFWNWHDQRPQSPGGLLNNTEAQVTRQVPGSRRKAEAICPKQSKTVSPGSSHDGTGWGSIASDINHEFLQFQPKNLHGSQL